MNYPHRPVLVEEVPRYLITEAAGIYVDGTVGSGGHSEAIGRQIAPQGRLICIDRDAEAIRLSKGRLATLGASVTLVRANYADLDKVLQELGVKGVHGVLLDLGMSTFQLEHSGRGFSFSKDEPLDMRMDPNHEVTAHQLVNTLPPKDLEALLRHFGEEKRAKSIVRVLVREREKRPIVSSGQLAAFVASVVPRTHGPGSKHPATRTFQALRIAVNKELEGLGAFLEKVPFLIAPGGRLVILSYHSLEDRMVKQAMVGWEKRCTCPPDFPRCVCGLKPLFRRIEKKGLKPGKEEIADNPRARSAILRASERI